MGYRSFCGHPLRTCAAASLMPKLGLSAAPGLFIGAATAWAFNWGGNNIENNVNINKTDNVNVNRSNTKFQDSANRAKEAGAKRPQNIHLACGADGT